MCAADGVRRGLLAIMLANSNVVLFYTDDLGVGDLSYSGLTTSLVDTPHVDRLAAEGMRFVFMHCLECRILVRFLLCDV